jgi:Restriction endonuclease S subunits
MAPITGRLLPEHENSIIIGRVGAYCGSVAYSKGRFWASDNTIVARPKSGNVRYFFYLLKELGLNRYAGGAAQPLVTQTVLKCVSVRIADISTQHRIASVLSAYDDLIENNTRRIAILEEMARRIYEEWFVHFRFPGHDDLHRQGHGCADV